MFVQNDVKVASRAHGSRGGSFRKWTKSISNISEKETDGIGPITEAILDYAL